MNQAVAVEIERPDCAESLSVDRDRSTRELLQCHAKTSDEREAAELRERVVSLNYSLASAVARRYSGRGIDSDDLQQVALLALVLAVRRFDPHNGRSFAAYAVPTISGELKRHFRDHGWMVRPPRALSDTYREIQSTVAELEQSGTHDPGVADIAQRLELSMDQVRAALGVEGCFIPASLDAPNRDSPGTTLADRIGMGGPDRTEELTADIALRQLVDELPVGDRRLLWLRFEMDLTQREIGTQLGISQMQVSRLLNSILTRLRTGFANNLTSIAGQTG
ncbi:MAG: sigma-70 family RNA polymerase sigma factor [Allobranchiibius sp.]